MGNTGEYFCFLSYLTLRRKIKHGWIMVCWAHIKKAIGYFIGSCSPPWSPVSMQRDLASKLGHPYPMDPCCRSAWMACGWPSMCALQHWSRYNRCCSGFEVDCTCWSSGPSTNTPNGQENSCKGAGLPFMVHWAMDIQYLLNLPTCVSSQGTKKHPIQVSIERGH